LTEKAEVLLKNVLETLRENGVTVTEKTSPEKTSYILEKGGVLEEHFWPLELGRRELQYLSRHFDVPIHRFFNAPEKIPIVKPSAGPQIAAPKQADKAS
jgi:hypothetical protein